MNHSARRINTLAKALGSKSYLEIGVEDGSTFHDVDIEQKVAVDVKFRFDYQARQSARTEYHEVPSDEYFANTKIRHFDIIFIDGLHVFDQVVRDLANAIVFSHSHSVILIDDTKPSDVYSAIPSLTDAIRFRRASGGNSGAWHGDVFKIVFYLHDFWPSLNYRTVTGTDNPQTLVWRSNISRRKPKFSGLEQISRITYFDMHSNLDLMFESNENCALSTCIGELSK